MEVGVELVKDRDQEELKTDTMVELTAQQTQKSVVDAERAEADSEGRGSR